MRIIPSSREREALAAENGEKVQFDKWGHWGCPGCGGQYKSAIHAVERVFSVGIEQNTEGHKVPMLC